MDLVTAALVLTWVVLVLIALGLAGMMRQLRDVQAAVHGHPSGRSGARLAPPTVRPREGAQFALILLVDDNCSACAEVAPAFAASVRHLPAHIEPVMLGYDNSTRYAGMDARFVADSTAYHHLDPGWRPALVLISAEGAVLLAEPVGSADALRTVAEHVAGSRFAQAPSA
ncbi:hypothetical protein ACPXB5_13025 [Micromonospora arida]|uniref:Thioredoxin domain-containing protein n=1 Tax=Micromonospora arida TaxID=2203715 RepID=A0A3N9WSU7_9ACTN|nr:hypothetical protein [Micromonospora arida]RQX03906.1 hypothetical protein DLJ58_29035 [Micromonospora arida]